MILELLFCEVQDANGEIVWGPSNCSDFFAGTTADRAYFVVPLTREAAEGTTLKLGPECLGEYSGRDLS